MDIRELIDRCGANEGLAWAELWQMVESAVLYPIRQLLRRWHFDLSLADDAMQELYIHLREDNLRRLRAFRGQSSAQFRNYLRSVGVRFTLKMIRKLEGAKRKESDVRQWCAVRMRAMTSEYELFHVLDELESLILPEERTKLRIVADHMGNGTGGHRDVHGHDNGDHHAHGNGNGNGDHRKVNGAGNPDANGNGNGNGNGHSRESEKPPSSRTLRRWRRLLLLKYGRRVI